MSDLDQSKIEALKKTLYSRTASESKNNILDLKKHEKGVAPDWDKTEYKKKEEEIKKEAPLEDAPSKSDSILKRILQGAAVFFFLSILAAVYIIFRGGNVIAASKIKFTMVTPATVSSGQATDMDISISNGNNSSLNLVDVVLSYPDGTRSADDQSSPLNTDRVSFASIGANQTVKGTARAVFFGQDGSTAKINVEIQYRVPGSNTVFSKKTEQDIVIGTSALSLSIDSLKETTSGQALPMTLTIKSNSQEVVKDVLLQASFPFGFNLSSSTPRAIANSSTWNLGDIEPGGTRTVTLSGIVSGSADETRFFRFLLGIGSNDDPNTISTQVTSVDQSVALSQPFLATTLLINNEPAGGFAAVTGENFNSSITLKNNLTTPVTDIEIDATVNGQVLDMSKLSAANGITHSDTGALSWSKFEDNDLAEIDPGQSVTVSFSSTLLKAFDPSLANTKNQKINIQINVNGRRINEANVPETITSSASATVPVSSYVALDASLAHGAGTIENEGPLPPKVNTPTQYTMTWSATNIFNDVTNAKVSAVLPKFLTWTGVTSPSAEKISFDPVSRLVTWDLGTLRAQGNATANPRQVSFQITYTPTIDQASEEPVLVDHATLSGTDSLTGLTLNINSNSVTTSLTNDPTYVDGDQMVSP